MQHNGTNNETLPPITIGQLGSCIEAVRAIGASLYVVGPSGIGKSEGIQEYCRQAGVDLVDYRLIYRDTVDLRGVPVPDYETMTTRMFPPIEFRFEGAPKCIFMDELPSASTQVQSAAYQIFLEKRIGEIQMRDEDFVIAAGNRTSDRGNVNRIPMPLRRRWFEVSIAPDVATWIKWAVRQDLNPRVRGFIRSHANLAYDLVPDEPSPDFRGWTMVARLLDSPAGKALDGELKFALLSGKVGRGAALEFRSFESMVDALPEFDDIVADPKKCIVPRDNPAALYAIVSSLTRVSNAKNINAVITYLERLPGEFGVLFFTDLVEAKHTLLEHPRVNEWLKANEKLWKTT